MAPAETVTPERPHGSRRAGFRPDIQGMRAIAVVSVLLFHAGLTWIGGGYVGVDVFFVLSGFLITGLLIREVERSKHINFLHFYARRLKRLAPTYLVVLLVTLIVVATVLAPVQRLTYLPMIAWAALYGANINLSGQKGGYFGATEPAPVTHFWSLAVEEQFYFVWPLLVALVALVARRWLRRSLALVFAIVTGVSLWLSISRTAVAPTEAYYLLHTRAWQLAIGGLLATIPAERIRLPRWSRTLALVVGVGLVVWSALTYNEFTPFPGSAALAPVLGGVLLIVSGTGGQAPGGRWLLENPVMVWFGDISYSLYLWHWPILVLPQLAVGHELSLQHRLMLAAGSVVVAWLNYRFIEAPLHHVTLKDNLGKTYLAALGLTFAIAIASIFLHVRTVNALENTGNGGVPQVGLVAALKATPADVRARYPDIGLKPDGSITSYPKMTPSFAEVKQDLAPIFLSDCNGSGRDGEPIACISGDPSATRTIVLAGDSHAGQWHPAIEAVAKAEGWRLVTYLKNGCPSVVAPVWARGEKPNTPRSCPAWQRAVWQKIQAAPPDVLILANYENGYAERMSPGTTGTFEQIWDRALSETLPKIPATTKLLYLADNRASNEDPNLCLSRNLPDGGPCSLPLSGKMAVNVTPATVAKVKAAGKQVLEITPLLCTTTECPLVIGNRLVYRDQSHITTRVALLLAPILATKLNHMTPLPGSTPVSVSSDGP